jgi:phosphoribosylformylglycinamidine cyclo-ligase
LAPHPSYLTAVRPLLDEGLVRGMAHITGGGLIDNVPRMVPDGLCARIDPGTWEAPPVFAVLVERGSIPLEERYRAFNMGIGFVMAVPAGDADSVVARTPDARIVGEVVDATGKAERKVDLTGITGRQM